jgi:hypothetical protein
MTFSKKTINLSVVATLLITAFFANSLVRSDKLSTSASPGQVGAVVILQADGAAPPPPPPPPPPRNLQSYTSLA